MNLIDTHCHINTEQFFENENQTVEAARAAGVERLIVVGFDRQTILRAIELADTYEDVYFTAAWHPVDVVDFDAKQDKELLYKAWEHPKCVGVGETGLDYHWDKSPHELQKEFFEWHIEEAIQRELPFTVHNRDAHQDVYDVLEKMYQKYGELLGVMHSYSGSVEMAERFLKLGMYLSISGVVTFKNAKNVKEVVKMMPENKLLIETDSPYLTPEPYRGKRNEPAYVLYVATEIGVLRNLNVKKVGEITSQNAKNIFKKMKK